jgi:hypothetical protein
LHEISVVYNIVVVVFLEALNAQEGLGGSGATGGVKTVIQGDVSETCAKRAHEMAESHPHRDRCQVVSKTSLLSR